MLPSLSNLFTPKESPKDVIRQIAEMNVIIVKVIEKNDPKKQEMIGLEISIFLFFLADYIVSKKKNEELLNTPWLFAAFKKMKTVILSEEPYLDESFVADMLIQRIQLYTKLVKKTNIQKYDFIKKVVEAQAKLITNILEENELSTYLPAGPFFEEIDLDYNPDNIFVVTAILEKAYRLCLSDYIKLLKRYSHSANNSEFDSLGQT